MKKLIVVIIAVLLVSCKERKRQISPIEDRVEVHGITIVVFYDNSNRDTLQFMGRYSAYSINGTFYVKRCYGDFVFDTNAPAKVLKQW